MKRHNRYTSFHTLIITSLLLIAAALTARSVQPVLLPDDSVVTDSISKPALSLPSSPLDSLQTVLTENNQKLMRWTPPMLPDEEKLAMEMAEVNRPLTPDDVCDILFGKIHDYAAQFLGRRYRLGATGPKAFDCSGFTQNIFKYAGLDLNRTSRAQYTQGEKIDDLKDVKPGDLLFFSGRRVSKTVGHVAMVTKVDPDTGSLEFIHASSSKGIAYQKFPDNGYFDKRYLGARRIIGSSDFPIDVSSLPTDNSKS